MTATNDVTGDKLVSTTSDAYRDNYDSIFGKDKVKDKTKNIKGRKAFVNPEIIRTGLI